MKNSIAIRVLEPDVTRNMKRTALKIAPTIKGYVWVIGKKAKNDVSKKTALWVAGKCAFFRKDGKRMVCGIDAEHETSSIFFSTTAFNAIDELGACIYIHSKY